MAIRTCVDCNFPLEVTATRCPICGSMDPFVRRDTLWLIASIAILLIIMVSFATLSIRLQF